MSRNVEIKAVARNFATQQQLAATIATAGPTLLKQHDTFFVVPSGRLKLREFPDGTGELIQYARPDDADSKTCEYLVVPTSRPAVLRNALARSLGIRAEVIKQRTLYLAGRTRIHFDEVENLGHFIELEVVLHDGENEAAGHLEARHLMQKLGIAPADLLAAAYVDLLVAKA